MNHDRGIAYCGLACCLCEHQPDCRGCRNDGCTGRDWCKHFNCCREKGLDGCWSCPDYPCADGMMFQKPRNRAFARFIQENGEAAFLNRMERNELAGLVYHYPGSLQGDYDVPEDEDAILQLIRRGKQ